MGAPTAWNRKYPLDNNSRYEGEERKSQRVTVLRFTVVSWRILRVSFEAYVSNEQPLAEKTRMSSSLLNTSFDSNAS